MSSGPQSCRDDENEWEAIKRIAKVTGNYKVYSREQVLATEAYRKYGMTGDAVTLYVNLHLDLDKLIQKVKADQKELATYLELKKKYEPS